MSTEECARLLLAPLLEPRAEHLPGFTVGVWHHEKDAEFLCDTLFRLPEASGIPFHYFGFDETTLHPVASMAAVAAGESAPPIFLFIAQEDLFHPRNSEGRRIFTALNLHRDNYRDLGLLTIFLIPASCYRTFSELAGNFRDYRLRFVEIPSAPSSSEEFIPLASSASRPVSLPFPSLGRNFVGRDTQLRDLARSLRENRSAAIMAARTIQGMGGVGKTRLAVEFAWRHLADYPAGIFFVTTDSADSLRQNLAALCAPPFLNLPEQHDSDTSIQFRAVLEWLQAHPGWLIILDNADTEDAAAAVDKILPQLTAGHVIIISRYRRWGGATAPYALDVLTQQAGADFLLTATDGHRVVTGDDTSKALEIARLLDGLPLALEQAAAYIRQKRIPLSAYVAHWHTHTLQAAAWHDERTMRYPQSVAITFQTSVAQLSANARALLDILSWLAPDPMPVRHLENLTALPDPRGLLIELCDLHLATLSADGTTFSVHRLLQEITRQQQDAPTPPALVTALSWVNTAFLGDSDDVRAWHIVEPLAPHATSIALFAADHHIPAPTARLLNQVAVFYHARAQHQTAEPLMRRALAMDEASFGKDHLNVAIGLNNLAALLQDTNRLAEAEPLMRQCLQIRVNFTDQTGHEHPYLQTTIRNFRSLLAEMGETKEQVEEKIAVLLGPLQKK